MIDLNEMIVFERVVREGSFTAAARALGLSKSSVSDKIQRLEERLGVRLLERTTRRLRLTGTGEDYHQRCARVVAEAREADLSISEARQVPHGVLRVTAAHLFGDAFLTPIIAEYLHRYPDTSVDVLLAERRVDLIEEGMDLAIRIGMLVDSQLVARKLGDARSAYYASPGYLERHGTPAEPGDLAGHRCVVIGHAIQARWPFVSPETPFSVPVVGRLVANSLVMGRDAAVLGQGIAYLPEFLCDDQVVRGELVTVLDAYCPGPYSLYAIYPSNRHLSVKVRAFVDLLIERTTTAPPWVARSRHPVAKEKQTARPTRPGKRAARRRS